MKNPSDGNILDAIYRKYYKDFVSYDESSPPRSSKIYVPVDCSQIAKELGMDSEILFGRLYYHLNKLHGYTQDDGSKVHLFALKTGKDRHTVNFPLLAAVLAEKNVSFNRYIFPLVLSLAALFVSIWALLKWEHLQVTQGPPPQDGLRCFHLL